MQKANLKYRDLTADEREAVETFAAEFGRAWKDRLAFDYWPNARIFVSRAGRSCHELHRLRNELGPAWLNQFKL